MPTAARQQTKRIAGLNLASLAAKTPMLPLSVAVDT
jgi:hypothetical protein